MALPKLHRSTIVFLVVVAVGLLLANVPGQLDLAPWIDDCNGQYGPDFLCDQTCCHGWPFAFLVRAPVGIPPSLSWRLRMWPLSGAVLSRSWWRLAADVLAGIVLLMVAGGAFEYWRRHRGRFQLCLIDVFVIVTLVACAEGFPHDTTIQLPRLPRLRGLNMYDAAFYGDGLEYLRDIEVLDLSRTDVGDDAMPKFAAMRNLKSLSLTGTKITDAGLEHLKGLTQLRELWLGGEYRSENVTAEGIKRLQRALPNCKIN